MSKSMEQGAITPNANVFSGFVRKATAVAAGSALMVSACSGDNNENVSDFQLPSDEIAAMCAAPTDGSEFPFALSSYQEIIGDGPYETNEASEADTPDNGLIRLEAAEELAEGNAFGMAYLAAGVNQKNSSYNPTGILAEAEDIFGETYDNPEAFSETCEKVVGALLDEGESSISYVSGELVEITAEYNEDGVLVGDNKILEGIGVNEQVPILGINTNNGGEPQYGIALGTDGNEARNGRLVLVKSLGDGTGEEVSEEGSTGELEVENGTTGDEETDTGSTGDNETDTGSTGDEETDTGSTGDEETEDGTSGAAEGDTDEEACGEADGGCDVPNPGNGPQTPGTTPGNGPSNPTGPGTTEGPTTTTGSGTTTTTVRPTTTTTTVRPTTTTSTTTTTVRPTTTTSTTTTTTTQPPTPTTKPPIVCDPVIDVCD